MNKIITIILSVTSFILIGCGQEKPIRSEQIEVEGSIKSLGNFKVSENVTHLIESSTKEIIYAYSNKYNLDDQKYKDVSLLIEGQLHHFKSFDRPQLEINKISPLEKTNPAENASEWLQTNQENLGLQFKNLSSWVPRETALGLRFESPQDKGFIQIELYRNIESLNPDEWTPVFKEDWAKEKAYFIIFGDEIQGVEYRRDNSSLMVFARENKLYTIESQWDEQDISKLNYLSFLQSIVMIPFSGDFEDEAYIEHVAPESLPPMSQTSSQGLQLSFEYPQKWYYQGDSSGFLFHPSEITSPQMETVIRLNKNSFNQKPFQKSKTINHTVWTIEADYGYEAIASYILESLSSISQ